MCMHAYMNLFMQIADHCSTGATNMQCQGGCMLVHASKGLPKAVSMMEDTRPHSSPAPSHLPVALPPRNDGISSIVSRLPLVCALDGVQVLAHRPELRGELKALQVGKVYVYVSRYSGYLGRHRATQNPAGSGGKGVHSRLYARELTLVLYVHKND
jgi:hypothetical protein